MKNVIISGASGLVANELIHNLLNKEGVKIYAVTTHPDKLSDRYKDIKLVECLMLNDLHTVKGIDFDVLVHCAFARSKDPEDLAISMNYTKTLLSVSKGLSLKLFVNISSQSVYGQTHSPLWTEKTPPAPDYLYAMGKYSTELLVSTALSDTNIKYTNIRLSSVCENARFLNVFVKNAIEGKPITVYGGSQICSFIDVRDVAEALSLVVFKGGKLKLEPVYNLGTNTSRSIIDLANDVKRIFMNKYNKEVTVNIQPSELQQNVGMDATLFRNTFNWHPLFDYDDMIESLIAINGGGRDAILS